MIIGLMFSAIAAGLLGLAAMAMLEAGLGAFVLGYVGGGSLGCVVFLRLAAEPGSWSPERVTIFNRFAAFLKQ